MPQMSQVLRKRAIGMLTAGMSTRAGEKSTRGKLMLISLPYNTVSHLQRRFREFGSTSNRPHNSRSRVNPPAQDLLLNLRDRLRPATRTADENVDLHNWKISAQTVRNCLREAHLHARLPHQGLDLTAVWRRNWLDWAILTFNGHWHTGEVFSSWRNPGFSCTKQMALCGWTVWWCQRCEQSAPW